MLRTLSRESKSSTRVLGMEGSPARSDDASLYEGVAAEARWAEVALFERFERRIRVLAVRRGVPLRYVDDIVQETLMGVVTAFREGRLEDRARLASFVYGTARNVISNMRRRHSLTAWPESVEDPDIYRANTPDPLTSLVRSEERRRVAACLAKLRDEDRAILEMAFYLGHPPREIAEELAVAPNVARQRKWRALRRFGEVWNELYDE